MVYGLRMSWLHPVFALSNSHFVVGSLKSRNKSMHITKTYEKKAMVA